MAFGWVNSFLNILLFVADTRRVMGGVWSLMPDLQVPALQLNHHDTVYIYTFTYIYKDNCLRKLLLSDSSMWKITLEHQKIPRAGRDPICLQSKPSTHSSGMKLTSPDLAGKGCLMLVALRWLWKASFIQVVHFIITWYTQNKIRRPFWKDSPSNHSNVGFSVCSLVTTKPNKKHVSMRVI